MMNALLAVGSMHERVFSFKILEWMPNALLAVGSMHECAAG